FQRDRPVETKIDMRAPKEPECDNHRYGPAPWNERGQMKISERPPRCEQIQRRQNDCPDNGQGQERAIARIHATEHFLIAFGASAKNTTDPHIDNHADQKNKVPRLDSHKCARERPSTRRSYVTVESETPF